MYEVCMYVHITPMSHHTHVCTPGSVHHLPRRQCMSAATSGVQHARTRAKRLAVAGTCPWHCAWLLHCMYVVASEDPPSMWRALHLVHELNMSRTQGTPDSGQEPALCLPTLLRSSSRITASSLMRGFQWGSDLVVRRHEVSRTLTPAD